MAENDPNEVLAQEILFIRQRTPDVVNVGKKHFADTALVTDVPWNIRVDDKIRQFCVEVAPLTPNTLIQDFWEHQLLTSIYARRIASIVGMSEISPLKASANGFLHDAGRIVIPHRYFVNDIVGNIIYHGIGFRQSFLKDMSPLDRILGFYNPVKDLEDLTLPQMINHVSDGLGRRGPRGDLATVYDLKETKPSRKYMGGIWSTEDQALALARESGREEWESHLRTEEVNYFHSKFGIDFEALREQIRAELEDPWNQQWLEAVKPLKLLGEDECGR